MYPRAAHFWLLLVLALGQPLAGQAAGEGGPPIPGVDFDALAEVGGVEPPPPCRDELDCGWQGCCSSQWTFTADALFLWRSRPDALDLPVGEAFGLGAEDFDFGVAAGPRLRLIRDLPNCDQLEICYWRINSSASTPPTGENGVRLAPVTLFRLVPVQTDEGTDTVLVAQQVLFNVSGDIVFHYESNLQSAEANWRSRAGDCVTLLAGFRWTELNETVEAVDFGRNLYTIHANDRLFGFQIGADATLCRRGRLRLDGLVKAGIYHNDAEVDYDFFRPRDAAAKAAFLGEFELTAVYQMTCQLSLRAGYQAMWLGGVALASDQLAAFGARPSSPPTINAVEDLLLHGAHVGVEYTW